MVPVEDMRPELPARPTGDPPAGRRRSPRSIWPHVEERIVDLGRQHRSTIVFANSRRLAERLTARLNEILDGELAAARAEIRRGARPPSASDPAGHRRRPR